MVPKSFSLAAKVCLVFQKRTAPPLCITSWKLNIAQPVELAIWPDESQHLQSSPRPLPLLAAFFPLCLSFIFLRPAASAFCSFATRSACPAPVSLGTFSRPISRIRECNLRKQAFALSACFRESSA
jgi:hypothetical protein